MNPLPEVLKRLKALQPDLPEIPPDKIQDPAVIGTLWLALKAKTGKRMALTIQDSDLFLQSENYAYVHGLAEDMETISYAVDSPSLGESLARLILWMITESDLALQGKIEQYKLMQKRKEQHGEKRKNGKEPKRVKQTQPDKETPHPSNTLTEPSKDPARQSPRLQMVGGRIQFGQPTPKDTEQSSEGVSLQEMFGLTDIKDPPHGETE